MKFVEISEPNELFQYRAGSKESVLLQILYSENEIESNNMEKIALSVRAKLIKDRRISPIDCKWAGNRLRSIYIRKTYI